jgi:hypothetical protein
MRVTEATVVLSSLMLAERVLAKDHESLARFEGGIDIIPVSSAAGAANLDGNFPGEPRTVGGRAPGADDTARQHIVIMDDVLYDEPQAIE